MGGKFFKDQNGNNVCSRIPTTDISSLINSIMSKFSKFFDKMEPVTSLDMVSKKDHGDIDFVVLASHGQREDLRIFLKENGYQFGHNGPMEHIAFPINVGNIFPCESGIHLRSVW